MDPRQIAARNLRERLAANPYPGRGLVLGMDEAARQLIQVYWIMGRSANSRNRVFETDGRRVWTEAADPAQCKDPSLIIYNALREGDGVYVVTNGDQTDTICDRLAAGGTFEEALATRDYEPDPPNFTPRISGLFDLRRKPPAATLSVLRRSPFGDATDRFFWRLGQLGAGLGHCITTYVGDGNPLPPFEGEPYLVPLAGDLGCIAHRFWDALNDENKVALCVKGIDPESLASDVVVINKNHKKA
ncbi:MAG TPA: IMP cyclohydrolase [Planctomycetota bacterium]|nr:IMP cyclohydrolase [Planctomycetota bacterium]HRR80327.1 IMP cyclohydrolase [Planctomycetota bacterium]HRT94133.1 IMP cyclohydrolase [Planctomycetota bacterium]